MTITGLGKPAHINTGDGLMQGFGSPKNTSFKQVKHSGIFGKRTFEERTVKKEYKFVFNCKICGMKVSTDDELMFNELCCSRHYKGQRK